MSIEVFVVVGVFTLAMLPLLKFAARMKSSARSAAAAVLFLVSVSAVTAWSLSLVGDRQQTVAEQEAKAKERPIEDPNRGYVTSQSCRACHPHQHATWHASFHRTMTQVATPETVVAPFDNVELTDRGKTYHLERRGDDFLVEMDDPLWNGRGTKPPRLKKRIVLTTGSNVEQDYWYTTGGPNNRQVGRFPFVYRIAEQQWIPDSSVLLSPPNTPRGFGNWNKSCIQCHTTLGRPRVSFDGFGDPKFDSRVAEFGIACEACHGPAENHVRINQNPARRYQQHLRGEADPTIVNPARLSADRGSQVCGQCHGVITVPDVERLEWVRRGYTYRPGDDLWQTRDLVRFHQGLDTPGVKELLADVPTFIEERFWSDGTVRVSGREYNGLYESPCFQQGHGENQMSCLSCHTMHKPVDDPRPMEQWTRDQLALDMRTNRACLQCHEQYKDEGAVSAHTHHLPTSTGSLCYNCHMNHTTYGLLKAIRSHRIDSPSVQSSLKTGRPNGCNQCHLDKTLAWTADHLNEWYGIEEPELSDEEQSVAASLLWLLKGDAGQRALMAWTLDWEPAKAVSGTGWRTPYLAQLLEDPYDAVRIIAERSLRRIPEYRELEYNFLDPPKKRAAANQRALEIWRRTNSSDRTTGDQLLISPDGSLHPEEFDHLLKQRDDRRVMLSE